MTTLTHLDASTEDIPFPSEQDLRYYISTTDSPADSLWSLMAIYKGKASDVACFLRVPTTAVICSVACLRYMARDWTERDILVDSPLLESTTFAIQLEWEETPDHLGVLSDLYSNTGMPVHHICAILGIDKIPSAASVYIRKHTTALRKQGAAYKTNSEQHKKLLALSVMVQHLSTVFSALALIKHEEQQVLDSVVVPAESIDSLQGAASVPPTDTGDTAPSRGFFGSLWELIKGRRF
jgi:hypothetical protein